jgi:hypothetical protein
MSKDIKFQKHYKYDHGRDKAEQSPRGTQGFYKVYFIPFIFHSYSSNQSRGGRVNIRPAAGALRCGNPPSF